MKDVEMKAVELHLEMHPSDLQIIQDEGVPFKAMVKKGELITIAVKPSNYERIMALKYPYMDDHADIRDNDAERLGGETHWYWKDARDGRTYGPFGCRELAIEFKRMKLMLPLAPRFG